MELGRPTCSKLCASSHDASIVVRVVKLHHERVFSVQFTARDLSVRIDSVERLVQYTDNSVELLGQSTAPGTSKCRCFGGDEGAMTPILALT